MDTRFLESFLAVADHGSMAEAARRLNLTPAAVAQRIRAVEKDIGAPLLARSGRTVVPTEAGNRILERSRAFLQAARDLRAVAVDDRAAGELRVGAVMTAMTGLVPDILAALARSHPLVRVHVVPGASGDLYDLVRRGDLDAALVVRPDFALAKACDWRSLRSEPLVVIAPASARGRDPLALLRREPFVRLSRETGGGRLVDRFLRRSGIQPLERFELTSLFAIALLVDRGLGVALVPDFPPPWPSGLALRKLPVRGAGLARDVGLVWTRANVRSRLVHAFLEAAARAVPGARRLARAT